MTALLWSYILIFILKKCILPCLSFSVKWIPLNTVFTETKQINWQIAKFVCRLNACKYYFRMFLQIVSELCAVLMRFSVKLHNISWFIFPHIAQSGCRVGHLHCRILLSGSVAAWLPWQQTAGPIGNWAKHYFILGENKQFKSDRSCLICVHVRIIATGAYF